MFHWVIVPGLWFQKVTYDVKLTNLQNLASASGESTQRANQTPVVVNNSGQKKQLGTIVVGNEKKRPTGIDRFEVSILRANDWPLGLFVDLRPMSICFDDLNLLGILIPNFKSVNVFVFQEQKKLPVADFEVRWIDWEFVP